MIVIIVVEISCIEMKIRAFKVQGKIFKQQSFKTLFQWLDKEVIDRVVTVIRKTKDLTSAIN